MQLEQFTIISVLGKGSYGKVYKVLWRDKNEVCVMKRISFANLTKDAQQEALNEIAVSKDLHHPNIIQYYNSFLENGYLFIVMEYAGDGDLFMLLHACKTEQRTISMEKIWEYTMQLCRGLKYLHDNRTLHRDLKTRNILIDGNTLKIADFGLGKSLNESDFAYSTVGTPLYISPELCQEQKYNDKSDIWALGCIIYEMMMLQPPFSASNQLALAKKIVSQPAPRLSRPNCSRMQNLLDRMLAKKMQHRPSINEIVKYIEHKSSNAASCLGCIQLSKQNAALQMQVSEYKKTMVMWQGRATKLTKKLLHGRKHAYQTDQVILSCKSQMTSMRAELKSMRQVLDQHQNLLQQDLCTLKSYVMQDKSFTFKSFNEPITSHVDKENLSNPPIANRNYEGTRMSKIYSNLGRSSTIKVLASDVKLCSMKTAKTLGLFKATYIWENYSHHKKKLTRIHTGAMSGIIVFLRTMQHHPKPSLSGLQVMYEENSFSELLKKAPEFVQFEEATQNSMYKSFVADVSPSHILHRNIIEIDFEHTSVHQACELRVLQYDRRLLQLIAMPLEDRELCFSETKPSQSFNSVQRDDHCNLSSKDLVRHLCFDN